MSDLLLSIMGAFAEFGRQLGKERPLDGIALDKARQLRKRADWEGSEDRPGPRFRDQPRDRLPVPVYQALTATLVFCQGSKAVPSGWERMGE